MLLYFHHLLGVTDTFNSINSSFPGLQLNSSLSRAQQGPVCTSVSAGNM